MTWSPKTDVLTRFGGVNRDPLHPSYFLELFSGLYCTKLVIIAEFEKEGWMEGIMLALKINATRFGCDLISFMEDLTKTSWIETVKVVIWRPFFFDWL
jgi:hypothetical protein